MGNYSYSGASLTFTAKNGGEYSITAYGGQGGGALGGLGAKASGDFNLAAGEKLEVVVGGGFGQGGGSGGGGGGSFVIETFNGSSAVYSPLVIAGGGGGEGYLTGSPTPGGPGLATSSGGAGYFSGGAGGVNGGGGGATNQTAGGGEGLQGVGGTGDYGFAPGGGVVIDGAGPTTPHFAGGNTIHPAIGPRGAYGGGGQGINSGGGGGGGGGYSGGGGGGASGGGGGGGGSYVSALATNQRELSGVNAGAGSVAIDAICYLRGTRISTCDGQKPIETLAIGDRVITRFGGIQPIKWIGRQSFGARFIANNVDKQPVRIHAGALGENNPARDLFVSPGHSMLVGRTLTLAKFLVNGVTITQKPVTEDVNYYQIELEGHDCIVAEGAWSETYADAVGWRNKFHNASEFRALYPGHDAPAEPRLCAPRPEHGPELQAALRPIAERAYSFVKPGPLRGYIDTVRPSGVIYGWAQDVLHPKLPVVVEATLDGRVIGSALACEHRADLEAAGIGRGFHAFTITASRTQGDIRVRRAKDGAELPWSACQVELCRA